jgi:DnaJ-class molecular chaperone
MAEDPYKVLGVKRDASADDIRSAYRKLAKKHHPDLNPGDKKAEEQFKAISQAHDILEDAEKRARYDRGEIDATGADRAPQFHPGAGAAGGGFGRGFNGGGGFEDIFADILGQRQRGPARGQDARYALDVSFIEAVIGVSKRITLPDGTALDVKVPPGTNEADVLRLRGKGGAGRAGGAAGDALIEVHVKPHPFFTREGRNVFLELPVSLKEAVLGGRVTVPTPAGNVAMTIKPGSETGTKLRLGGRGVPEHGHAHAGDMHVTLKVVIGPHDAALAEFLKSWEQKPFHPREGLGVEG